MRTTKGKRIAVLAGCLVVLVLAFAAWTCWDEILFSYRFESLGNNVQGHPEYRHRQIGIVFVRLPGGDFWMGSSKGEGERSIEEFVRKSGEDARKRITERVAAEQPRHKATLSSFLIAKYEVSQAEWEQVTGNKPSHFKGENLPVEQVSWEDCQEFCEKRGLSLPTEAQWEYACRAGTSTPFAFGETLTKTQANFSGKKTVPVDSFEPNGFGLHNMHGNVWEWCEDVYDPEFYRKPDAATKNPVSASGSGSRVLRGGCRYYDAGYCRSAHRNSGRPSIRNPLVGFRPVASAP